MHGQAWNKFQIDVSSTDPADPDQTRALLTKTALIVRSGRFLHCYQTFSAFVHTTRMLASELAFAVLHLCLESGEDRRVHLTDAALRQIERNADLLHRHFLVVVEDDDQPLGSREPLG